MKPRTGAVVGLAAWLVGACSAPRAANEPVPVRETEMEASARQPTAAEAAAFVESAEDTLYAIGLRAGRAAWVQSTYITHDTEILAAEANERYIGAAVGLGTNAARYNALELPNAVARKLQLLKLGLSNPAPRDAAKTAELARLLSGMESRYGAGEYCRADGTCLSLTELEEIIGSSRDPAELEEAWRGWRTISMPMRAEYRRFVELANEGARELGFPDLGAMWRSNYDMPPDAFAAEVDRLWGQVKPLYDALHCHVRARLGQRYGTELVPPDHPIPAHLLGNMWAQGWGNIYELVAPEAGDPGYDLTERLRASEYDALGMVRTGEAFFTSLGLQPLPATFWERSLFIKPADRDVVCHASAWDMDARGDVRIKMCIEVDDEDFQTVHHELGHLYYDLAYSDQPYLFRAGANDGFHEALGDAIALSITPEYLREIGLIERVPPADADLGLLMRDALEKVAFLPFGLLVDQWRWQVFSGEIGADAYNAGWWQLRERYQGVRPPTPRSEEHFDPGAKYHVPANVPYTRYFLAHILQFQFHRALCAAAGQTGPLHRCSIYGNREAGRRLQAMMALGASRPWPDALEALTGSRELDATAILDYFAPLQAWLSVQNAGRVCGW
ncbi:MAG: M2 family metallopeptidase [Longimicrobiales bacterium]